MSDTAVVDWADWLATMRQPSVLIELGSLLLCALLAWQLARLVSRAFEERELNSIMFARPCCYVLPMPPVNCWRTASHLGCSSWQFRC